MDYDTKSYLPECLYSIAGNITSASLKSQETKGRIVHTYSVTWMGQPKAAVQLRPSPPAKIPEPKKSVAEPIQKPELVVRKVRCDGPCKLVKPFSEMHIIGLCEHCICLECQNTKPSIPTSEGGSHCPNEDCYTEDLIVQKRRKMGRSACVFHPEKCANPLGCMKTKSKESLKSSTTKGGGCQADANNNLGRCESSQIDYDTPYCIKSNALATPVRSQKPTGSSSTFQNFKVHLKIDRDGWSKWLEDDIPGDWSLLDAIKDILHNNNQKPSAFNCNFVSKMRDKKADAKEWTRMSNKELAKCVKEVAGKEAELYLAFTII